MARPSSILRLPYQSLESVVLPYLFRREAVQGCPDFLHVPQHEVTHDVEPGGWREGVQGEEDG